MLETQKKKKFYYVVCTVFFLVRKVIVIRLSNFVLSYRLSNFGVSQQLGFVLYRLAPFPVPLAGVHPALVDCYVSYKHRQWRIRVAVLATNQSPQDIFAISLTTDNATPIIKTRLDSWVSALSIQSTNRPLYIPPVGPQTRHQISEHDHRGGTRQPGVGGLGVFKIGTPADNGAGTVQVGAGSGVVLHLGSGSHTGAQGPRRVEAEQGDIVILVVRAIAWVRLDGLNGYPLLFPVLHEEISLPEDSNHFPISMRSNL